MAVVMTRVVVWGLMMEEGASVMFREFGYFSTRPLLAAKRAAHKAGNATTALRRNTTSRQQEQSSDNNSAASSITFNTSSLTIVSS
jgi:hypothetical protein